MKQIPNYPEDTLARSLYEKIWNDPTRDGFYISRFQNTLPDPDDIRALKQAFDDIRSIVS